MKIIIVSLLAIVYLLLIVSQPCYAMHIMEGFLPLSWAVFWALLSLPFLIYGIKSIQKVTNNNPRFKMLLVFAGAFTFVLSALKIPSVTGSCSHPTGVGLGSILFGPTAMTVISSIVLLFQSILLAHGGITTLGANIFSMGIIGPFVACAVYYIMSKTRAPLWLNVFLASALGNMSTYITTSIQLSLAFPAETGGIAVSLIKFLSLFALTQIPLAISEGLLTVLIFNFLSVYNYEELAELRVVSRENHYEGTQENESAQNIPD